MDTSQECPICRREVRDVKNHFESWTFTYDCETCGRYSIAVSAKDDYLPTLWNRQDLASLAKISAFTKWWALRDAKGVSLRNESDDTAGLPGSIYTLEEALNAFPRSISERIDRALLNLALKAPKLYTPIRLHPHDDYPIFYALDGNEQRYMMELLKERGYLGENDTLGDIVVWLTTDGWQRIDELEREPAEKPRQGFVAMWFDDSMQEARKRGFIAGIKDAGYDEKVMADRDDFNEDIHDEIIAEIRKSRFVIADFTENRPNVYYEAGFAEALGKPVIYTCRDDYIEETHFDIRQRNHIVWKESDIDKLRKRLRDRIEATIGLPAS